MVGEKASIYAAPENLECGDEGNGGHVPLWIIHLIKVERDSFRKVPQTFVDCAALAGHIDLRHCAMHQSSSRPTAAVKVRHMADCLSETPSILPWSRNY